jgi:hypothetical protein
MLYIETHLFFRLQQVIVFCFLSNDIEKWRVQTDADPTIRIILPLENVKISQSLKPPVRVDYVLCIGKLIRGNVDGQVVDLVNILIFHIIIINCIV